MRPHRICTLACALGLAAASTVVAAERTLGDRIEMLDWSDPERAAQFIDAAPAPAGVGAADLQMLEVRGMVYADVHRDADVDAIIALVQ